MSDAASPADPALPLQSPLFHAEQAARYDRQALIRAYEEKFHCRLIVVVDAIFPYGVTLFEELIYDADPDQDLHLMLASPGGDGETAVRLVRAAQSRCKELTVVVPDQAKSAATLLVMGAHHILMGPTSDLGPVDPQFQLPDGSLASAKDIIAAVDDATEKVQHAPDTYPIYAAPDGLNEENLRLPVNVPPASPPFAGTSAARRAGGGAERVVQKPGHVPRPAA